MFCYLKYSVLQSLWFKPYMAKPVFIRKILRSVQARTLQPRTTKVTRDFSVTLARFHQSKVPWTSAVSGCTVDLHMVL